MVILEISKRYSTIKDQKSLIDRQNGALEAVFEAIVRAVNDGVAPCGGRKKDGENQRVEQHRDAEF